MESAKSPCALGMTRTSDTQFRKLMLYPPELQGHIIRPLLNKNLIKVTLKIQFTGINFSGNNEV